MWITWWQMLLGGGPSPVQRRPPFLSARLNDWKRWLTFKRRAVKVRCEGQREAGKLITSEEGHDSSSGGSRSCSKTPHLPILKRIVLVQMKAHTKSRRKSTWQCCTFRPDIMVMKSSGEQLDNRKWKPASRADRGNKSNRQAGLLLY